MKIILPMAGKGSRFAGSNYGVPKPLIEVNGRPMFHWALDSIKNLDYSSIHVTALSEHESAFHLSSLIPQDLRSVHLQLVDETPDGQLMSVLAHANDLNDEEDILIISSDTLVISQIAKDITQKKQNISGLISVINLPGDMWSFAKTDDTGKVVEVAEKTRISDNASTGLYYFSHGSEFLKYSKQVIESGNKVKGEYYVIPVYQEYIKDNREIGVSQADAMWDMGNPLSLEHFLKEYQSK